MVRRSNDTNLLRYRKKGFSKVGLFDYDFVVDYDGNAQVDMSLSKETVAQGYSSGKVRLSTEELNLVMAFVINIFLPLRKDISSFESEIGEPYEEASISAGGVCISGYDKDALEIKSKFDALHEFLGEVHPKLSGDSIADVYKMMERDLYADTSMGK